MKIRKQILAKGIDDKYLGHEPTWNNTTTEVTEPQLRTAYNWYNYNTDTKDHRQFLEEYLELNRTPKNRKSAILAVEDWRITTVIGATARMQTMGLDLGAQRMKGFTKRLDELERLGKTRLEERKAQQNKPVIDLQARVRAVAANYIAELEEKIDEFTEAGCTNKTEFVPYDFYRAKDMKPIYSQHIIDHYTPLSNELQEAVNSKDPDLLEAYRLYSKKQLKNFSAFVDTIIEDAKKLASNKRKAKTPRKKREKSTDQILKRLKYQKEEPSLKISSISPDKILGASEIWLFNTKYNVLQHYVAIDRGGITVKGTTLQNFDEKTSFCKKIRKPEEVLSKIVSGGPKAVIKLFEAIKTKQSPCNGRVNEATVILRVVS
jgi:hypothetical protein